MSLTAVATAKGHPAVTAPVQADGTFHVQLPVGAHYVLRFTGTRAGHQTVLGTACHQKTGHPVIIAAHPNDDGEVDLGDVGEHDDDMDEGNTMSCSGSGHTLPVSDDQDNDIQGDDDDQGQSAVQCGSGGENDDDQGEQEGENQNDDEGNCHGAGMCVNPCGGMPGGGTGGGSGSTGGGAGSAGGGSGGAGGGIN
jgi:hypothetical protein